MVTNQVYLFFIFAVNGMLIGLLFDFFRISRKVFSTSDVVTYIEDFLFWILAGASMLYSIFIFNNGELRLYMFLGIILGAFLYLLFISSYVIKINVKIINFLKKILCILFMPFKFVNKFLQKIFLKPITFLFINIRKNFTSFGMNIVKKLKISKKAKNIVKN